LPGPISATTSICSIELPQLSLLLVPLVCWIVMSEGATLISC